MWLRKWAQKAPIFPWRTTHSPTAQLSIGGGRKAARKLLLLAWRWSIKVKPLDLRSTPVNLKDFLIAATETLIMMAIMALILGLSFAPYLETF